MKCAPAGVIDPSADATDRVLEEPPFSWGGTTIELRRWVSSQVRAVRRQRCSMHDGVL
jgi:hypothetical protein